MHIVWIVLEVIGGLFLLAIALVLLFAFMVTKDGSNPFQ
jgi:hypothetical protein